MYETERQELADKLRTKEIKNEAVLEAVAKVERHLFVPDVMKQHAYNDTALPIGYGQTISQPYTVAFQTQALNVVEGDKVLEIGTGSGYQAAILAAMGVKVYSIERSYDLYSITQKLFDEIGIRVAMRCGDGTLGWNEYAPYDGIVVTAGAPVIPATLKNQLKVNGRMVIPVGDRKSQTMKVLTKLDDDNFAEQDFPQFSFVPLIGKQGWKE